MQKSSCNKINSINMSSNLCVLIKVSHKEFHNCENVLKLISQSKKENLCLTAQTDSDEDNCIYFIDYKMKLYMKEGYYILDTLRRYSSILNRKDGDFTIRNMICDIVKALGERESFYFEDNFDFVYENYDLDFLESTLSEEYGESLDFHLVCNTNEIFGKLIHDNYRDR